LNKLKGNQRAISGLTVLVVLLLVSTGAIAAFLTYSDAKKGGMREAWRFTENDLANTPTNISLMYQGSDGTIYAFETQSYYPNYFMAFDPNGNLKWRAGVNAQPYPVQGPDGGFYYVDWPYITLWMDDTSKGGWYNLTALDSNGNLRWNYLVDNGTLSILAIYDDGTVVAHHYNSEYDDTNGTYVTLIDTIIEISNNGTELWEIDRPLPELAIQEPRIGSNGTFLMNAYDSGGTYEIGIFKNGTSGFIQKADFVPGSTPGPSSVKNGIQYEVRRVFTDNETSIISLYANNISDGGQVWKTVLEYSDNPNNFTAGYWVGQDTFVDSDATIYCGDIVGNHTYAINPDGSIKWQVPYLGVIWGTYNDGGILVSDSTSIKRIQSDGSTGWTYDVGKFGSDYSRVILSPDQIVYYSLGTTIVALAHPDNIGGNGVIIVILVVFDLIILGYYGRVVWMGRKSKKNHENAAASPKKNGERRK
jgi:hypothetical protein